MYPFFADAEIDQRYNEYDTKQNKCGSARASLLIRRQRIVNESDHRIETSCVIRGTHLLTEDTYDARVFLEAADEACDDNICKHGA